MKKYAVQFVMRGLVAASGGPVILAIIYGVLGITDAISVLSPGEVCLGIISITLMAFIAAGITTVYQIERLPLLSAILIHGGVLYLDYLLIYLLNDWVPRNLKALGIFTGAFVIGYVLVWIGIYLSIRRKTERINKKLH